MKKGSASFGASLIELIVAVASFAVVAACCVQIFVYAASLSRESADLSSAVLLAESAAEAYRSAGDIDEAARLFGTEAEYPDPGLTGARPDEPRAVFSVYYDENFEPTDIKEKAGFLLECGETSIDGVFTCTVTVKTAGDDHVLYSLRTAGKEAAS